MRARVVKKPLNTWPTACSKCGPEPKVPSPRIISTSPAPMAWE